MSDDAWTGRLIDNRYVVESVLGEGGMGLVLKARHKFTGVDVAVKILRPELQLDTDVQMRFLGEARASNAIGHPGIVQVVDAGKAPDGRLYLVMELLQGRPLRDAMEHGDLTHPEIRRIMMELFDALGAAHVRGFVHRDLKPENVFLAGPAGTVKLLDFGIAKVLDAGLSRVRTAFGMSLGTPAYMAPEQINDASGVDARADLWAAGVMIFEMLCGHLPFAGDTTTAFLAAITTKDPAPIRAFLPNAPPELEAFFSRALSRELFRRFASAQEMAQAFAALPLGFAPVATGAGFTSAGSRPAPAVPPYARATGAAPALSTAASRSAPSSTAPRSRAGLVLGVLGVLALIAAVTIVVLGRGGHPTVAKEGSAGPPHGVVIVQTPAPTDAASGSPDAAVAGAPFADAAVVAQAVDAGALAPPVDAAVAKVPRDAGAKTVHKDAGVKPDAAVAKVTPGAAKNRCAAQGTATCRSALNCQRRCEDEDHDCRCLCAATAHPSHQHAITDYAICAKGCGFGKVCMAINCKKVVATCLAR